LLQTLGLSDARPELDGAGMLGESACHAGATGKLYGMIFEVARAMREGRARAFGVLVLDDRIETADGGTTCHE
jgi:hypothetical protein